MDILIEANAFKVNGEELSNLSKTDITRFITLNVGKEKLPELRKTKEKVQDSNEIDRIKKEYDENII